MKFVQQKTIHHLNTDKWNFYCSVHSRSKAARGLCTWPAFLLIFSFSCLYFYFYSVLHKLCFFLSIKKSRPHQKIGQILHFFNLRCYVINLHSLVTHCKQEVEGELLHESRQVPRKGESLRRRDFVSHCEGRE